jgi:hypothetical protein
MLRNPAAFRAWGETRQKSRANFSATDEKQSIKPRTRGWQSKSNPPCNFADRLSLKRPTDDPHRTQRSDAVVEIRHNPVDWDRAIRGVAAGPQSPRRNRSIVDRGVLLLLAIDRTPGSSHQGGDSPRRTQQGIDQTPKFARSHPCRQPHLHFRFTSILVGLDGVHCSTRYLLQKYQQSDARRLYRAATDVP